MRAYHFLVHMENHLEPHETDPTTFSGMMAIKPNVVQKNKLEARKIVKNLTFRRVSMKGSMHINKVWY